MFSRTTFRENHRAPRALRGAIWLSAAVLLAGVALPVSAQTAPTADPPPQSTDEKIAQLQKKLDELEQRLKEAEQRRAASVTNAGQASLDASYPTAGGGGFTVRSIDNNFFLRIGADVQIDNRTYLGRGAGSAIDTIVPRRLRPTLSGTV